MYIQQSEEERYCAECGSRLFNGHRWKHITIGSTPAMVYFCSAEHESRWEVRMEQKDA